MNEIFTESQVNEVVDHLKTMPEGTKIYFGCDSVSYFRDGKSFAKFATVLIVHKGGRSGCRIFAHKSTERIYDVKKNRPKMRMMIEVSKVTDLYRQLMPHIEQFAELIERDDGTIAVKEFEVEIHLDISTNPMHGSNCAAKEATGYVLGMTGIEPHLKPFSWASSFGSDHVVNKAW